MWFKGCLWDFALASLLRPSGTKRCFCFPSRLWRTRVYVNTRPLLTADSAAAIGDVSCVYPSIRFCLNSLTCRSVINGTSVPNDCPITTGKNSRRYWHSLLSLISRKRTAYPYGSSIPRPPTEEHKTNRRKMPGIEAMEIQPVDTDVINKRPASRPKSHTRTREE